MLRIKIKAFFKYKEYRKYAIKKLIQKGLLKNLIIYTVLAVLFLSSSVSLGMFLNTNLSQVDFEGMKSFVKDFGVTTEGFAKEEVKATQLEVNNAEEKLSSDDTEENLKMKEEYEEVLKKIKQLEEENGKLKEDNIVYQNSLKIAASRGATPRNYRMPQTVTSRSGILGGEYLGEFTVTAYTPSADECGNDKGITCSGHPIVPGVTVAVDRRYWPIGTTFYIKGLGYVVAMDSGGAIKGRNRFDFAVLDKEFAKRIGVRKFEVYLIKLGNGKVEETNFN